jgi:hypothetical protein
VWQYEHIALVRNVGLEANLKIKVGKGAWCGERKVGSPPLGVKLGQVHLVL